MNDGCLFCQIFNGQVKSEKVYEDENVIGFKDINPVAKIHILFIHKNHSDNVNNLIIKNPNDILDIYKAIHKYTSQNELESKGFRVVTNVGKDSGQAIFHTHFHLLAGEKLKWP